MKTPAAMGGKHGFGRLIGVARDEPVAIAKHGSAVIVALSVE